MKKGHKYINKDGVNKVVSVEELEQYLNDGWQLGNTKCKNFGYTPWNKGLTKETSKSVRAISESKLGVPRSEETREKVSKSLTGRKLTEEHKQNISLGNTGKVVSEETRNKISQSKMGHITSEETKAKISASSKGRVVTEQTRKKISAGNRGKRKSDAMKKKLSLLHLDPEFQQKINDLKREHGTFNTSIPEETYYDSLVQIYGEDDIIRQYKDARYPFNCDFYIKSLDMFIELNLHWTHGGHPFDEHNINDLELAEEWKMKSNESQYYKIAYNVWTDLDVRKQKIAKDNNLNYKVVYTIE